MARRHRRPGCAVDERRDRAARSRSPPFVDLNGDRLRRGRRGRPPDPARHASSSRSRPPRYGLPADPTRHHDRRRHARSSGSRPSRRRWSRPRSCGSTSIAAATSRPTSLTPRRPRPRPGPPQHRLLVHGELPDRRRLPAARRVRRPSSPSRCSTTSPRTTRASGGCCSTCCRTLNPDWVERNPADLGIALVELLAYEGDRLSYFQDAVANEAYLDTVRTRISARRHARLIDYRMHDGRNAWAPVRFEVERAGDAPARNGAVHPAHGAAAGRGRAARAADRRRRDHRRPASSASRRCAASSRSRPRTTPTSPAVNNEIAHPQRGATRSAACRPATTEAYLYAVERRRPRCGPMLAAGDRLVFEEVLGPRTGAAADADPAHRQLVLHRGGRRRRDRSAVLATRSSAARSSAARSGRPALPLLRVALAARRRARTSPLCLSARLDDGRSCATSRSPAATSCSPTTA